MPTHNKNPYYLYDPMTMSLGHSQQLNNTPFAGFNLGQPAMTPQNTFSGLNFDSLGYDFTTPSNEELNFNYKDKTSYAPYIESLKLLQGFGNLYLGNKFLGLQEDQFDFNKDLTNRNILNQTTTYNTNIRDRKAADLASSGAYGPGHANKLQEDLDRYVAANRLPTKPIR